LTRHLAGPESVTDVQDLKVTLTVTNNGQDPVNILHEPNGALSKFPTDKFIITNEQNSQPKFTGIKAKYVPAIAAKSGQYTTLKPGESVTTEHDRKSGLACEFPS
jgi:peptidyl-Lys metalloendopeptidase